MSTNHQGRKGAGQRCNTDYAASVPRSARHAACQNPGSVMIRRKTQPPKDVVEFAVPALSSSFNVSDLLSYLVPGRITTVVGFESVTCVHRCTLLTGSKREACLLS